MHLRNFVKLNSSHLLVSFVSISSICAQEGWESPIECDTTQPPSKEDVTSMNDGDDSRRSSSAEQGLSPALTSLTATPQLTSSPSPENASLSMINLGASSPRNNISPIIRVFVYSDEGVMSNASALWKGAFAGVSGNFELQDITADMIQSGALNINTCDLFIMPGGRATPFHEKLGSEGKAEIKNYARSGGKCLGVGAGAYFLSQKSDFHMVDNRHMVKEGVGLLHATAIGPCSPVEKVKFHQGGVSFPITYPQEPHRPQASVFCNGGGFFEGVLGGNSTASVIAETASGQAVVVKEDNSIFTGVHPEFSPTWVGGSPLDVQEVLTQTSRELLRNILQSLSLI